MDLLAAILRQEVRPPHFLSPPFFFLSVDLIVTLCDKIGFFDETSTGDLTSRLTADCSEM